MNLVAANNSFTCPDTGEGDGLRQAQFLSIATANPGTWRRLASRNSWILSEVKRWVAALAASSNYIISIAVIIGVI